MNRLDETFSEAVYHEVHGERVRAHSKHLPKGGSMETKLWHDPIWLAVLTEEVGEVARVLCEASLGNIDTLTELSSLREELIQVAAMACAWVAAIDEYGKRTVEFNQKVKDIYNENLITKEVFDNFAQQTELNPHKQMKEKEICPVCHGDILKLIDDPKCMGGPDTCGGCISCLGPCPECGTSGYVTSKGNPEKDR